MSTNDKPAGLEPIAEQECLYLLGLHRLGRVAINVDGRPQVYPVNYALSGRVVAFRTAPGTKLANAPMSHVAFEIDEYDSSTGVGWSVMVKGVAYEITDAQSENDGHTTAWQPVGDPYEVVQAAMGAEK